MKRKKSFFRRSFFLFLIVALAGLVYYTYRTYFILKQVHQFENQVEIAAEKNDIFEYKDLIMSIILTETKGQGSDPMQSSESAFGEPNQISDPQASIDQGVAYLAKVIQRSEEAGVDLWTAVQAYNFGVDYIDYVAENGGINTLELAEAYSKEVLSPLLGNTDQTTYRYLAIHSIIYNGGYLYHNGGNLFYAELVKLNEYKIRLAEFVF